MSYIPVKTVEKIAASCQFRVKRSNESAYCHRLVARSGVEPEVQAYEARVLPLHYRAGLVDWLIC